MGNEQSSIANGWGPVISTKTSTPLAKTRNNEEEKAKALERAKYLEQTRLANVAKKRAEREAVERRESAERKAASEAREKERQDEVENAGKLKPPSESKAALQAKIQGLKRELAERNRVIATAVVLAGSSQLADRSIGGSSTQGLDTVVRGGPPRAPKSPPTAGILEGNVLARGSTVQTQQGSAIDRGREDAPSLPDSCKPRVHFNLRKTNSQRDGRGGPPTTPATTSQAHATSKAGPPTAVRPAVHPPRQEAIVPSRDVAPPSARPTLDSGRRELDVARSGSSHQATDTTFSRRSSSDSAVAFPQPEKQQPVNGRTLKVATGPSRHRASSGYNDGAAAPLASVSGVKRPAAPPTRVDQSHSASDNETLKRRRISASASTSPRIDAAVLGDRQPPLWYRGLSISRTRDKDEAAAAVEPQLQGLKTKIRNAKTQPNPTNFNAIRNSLHTLPFEKVNEKLLRNNGMLSNENGLPQLFDARYAGGIEWPFDIKADAEELYIKWSSRIFENDLLRGIIPGRGKSGTGDRTSDRFDPEWIQADFDHFGNGNLVNGQWWPTQLAALRDGAHGSAQGGISGKAGQGAWSCIMSGGHDYADVDNGEEVLYCGTDSADGKITPSTKLMLESYRFGRAIRLLRSHNLPSKWAPELGVRYDGLYDIKSYELLDPVYQRHRFRLVRRPGQPPIRGTGPEKRPTQQEMDAHQRDKRLRGIIGGGGNGKGKKGTTFPTWG